MTPRHSPARKDGGQRCFDALVAGDLLPARGQGDIEIHTNKDAFILQVEIANG